MILCSPYDFNALINLRLWTFEVYKASALSDIAESIGKLNQPKEAAKLLKLTLDSANQIKDDYSHASALSALTKSIGKLNQPEEAAKLLKLALDSANQIQDRDQALP